MFKGFLDLYGRRELIFLDCFDFYICYSMCVWIRVYIVAYNQKQVGREDCSVMKGIVRVYGQLMRNKGMLYDYVCKYDNFNVIDYFEKQKLLKFMRRNSLDRFVFAKEIKLIIIF